MNTASISDSQQTTQQISLKGVEKAKKKPPKLIERVIDKVEEMLTQPADPQQQSQQQEATDEVKEVALPKGTTITLPDGKSFVTQTESTLRKGVNNT